MTSESGFESSSEIEAEKKKKSLINFSICSALSPTRIKEIKNNQSTKESAKQKTKISAQENMKKATGKNLKYLLAKH